MSRLLRKLGPSLALPSRSGHYPVSYRTVLFPDPPESKEPLPLETTDMLFSDPTQNECIYDTQDKYKGDHLLKTCGAFILGFFIYNYATSLFTINPDDIAVKRQFIKRDDLKEAFKRDL